MLPAIRSPHVFCLTANEKDFSLSLEMTNVGERYSRIVSLPHWGKGTASAVDRVLSFILDLRRISLALFHTASTLSAPSGHLPLEGKALSVDIVFPHMRVFVLTMREKRYSRFAAFPIGKGGPRSGG